MLFAELPFSWPGQDFANRFERVRVGPGQEKGSSANNIPRQESNWLPRVWSYYQNPDPNAPAPQGTSFLIKVKEVVRRQTLGEEPDEPSQAGSIGTSALARAAIRL